MPALAAIYAYLGKKALPAPNVKFSGGFYD